jgi:very-short-patch-repair endonuclease
MATPPPQDPVVTPERREKVDKARQVWIKKLIDLSRRNNLLFYKDLQTGTLDLSAAPADAIHALLQSSREGAAGVTLNRLVPARLQQAQAAARLKEVATRAQMNLEERGLDTLFLGMGMASWQPGDDGRETEAPIVLVPLLVIPVGRESRSWTLKRNGDVRVSDVLLHALQVQQGVTLEAEALLPEILGDDEGEDLDLEPLFDRLRVAAEQVPGFTISNRYIVSNFHFQKLAIVKDLKEHANQLAAHDVIAGIAGDQGARERARGDRSLGEPRELDAVTPDDEFLIRDADSTQQQAIALALKGRNGVISGPPGTGKSQTIANLIAEHVARGKTVLFVAEKRAALDVVLDRLKASSLGHLCLDLHGAEISRKLVARQFKESLDVIRSVTMPDSESLHRQFAEKRDKLNAHVRRMHVGRAPAGFSVYELLGKLARLPEAARNKSRWTGAELAAFDAAKAEQAATVLSELATSFPGLVTGTDPSPWTGAILTSADTAQNAMDRAGRLAHRWSAVRSALRAVESANTVRPCTSVRDVQKMLDVLAAVDAALARYSPSVFSLDLDRLKSSLSVGHGVFGRAWATCTNSDFRAARAALLSSRTAGKAAVVTLLEEVDELQSVQRKWRDIAQPATMPSPIQDASVLRHALDEILDDLKGLLQSFPGRPLDGVTLTVLTNWLPCLAGDGVTPFRIVRAAELERELQQIDGGRTLTHIRHSQPDPQLWGDVFRYAWFRSCLDEAWRQDPSIPAFNGRSHDAVVKAFKKLDRERLEVAVARVRRAHAERVIAVRNRHRDQDGVVSREAEKKSRHLPLRQLLSEAPDVLLALRPCWMASPLSVSQLIPADRPLFDIVVFDEASQVLPEDAATSLLRGRQAVVAGDRHQLPPTAFFAAGEGDVDDDEATEVSGFESILDVMSAFLEPAWSLDWHYRSRDESLIAFSNHHIYGGRLVTFPGPGRGLALAHHHAPQRPEAGSEESGGAEVDRVVQLVLDHARTQPGASLGVITMGVKHARRVDAALDRARKDHPELDSFFAADRPERFFVKNLERVQGDERDAIILTVGYGKDSAGKLLYRFGPLLTEGGERRLNVAITRARQRMDVVSSFTHHDMEPGRSRAKGVELLRAYIEYAVSGGTRLDTSVATAVPLNEFEQSVHDALVNEGLTLVPQLGTSRYRIDLVAMHPLQPGRSVLAIECDGASYHSSPTARDRDRLRQQHLEALGWTFHRIWSTDWFLRRDEEIARTLKRYDEALRHAERPADFKPRGVDPVADGASVRAVTVQPTTRKRRQPVPSGRGPIVNYSAGELDRMVHWVRNGELLTDDQIVREVAQSLGFERVGNRIDEAIRSAIRRSEAQPEFDSYSEPYSGEA